MEDRVTAEAPAEQSRRPASLEISWPLVAGAASLVAVSSVAALILLIAIRQPEILSATALSLAIMAFILQLVVFIAEAWTSSQQSLHSQMLNTETRLLLTEVRASAQGMERMMTSQFERMLDHVLSTIPRELDELSAKTDAVESSDGDAEETMRQLRDRLRDHWDDEMKSLIKGASAAQGPQAQRQATPEELERAEALQTYPGEGPGREALELLRRLPPESVAMLRRYGEDEVRSLQRGEEPGLRGSSSREPFRRALVEAGLLRQDPHSENYHLTEAGREAARLLIATGERPAYLVAADGNATVG